MTIQDNKELLLYFLLYFISKGFTKVLAYFLWYFLDLFHYPTFLNFNYFLIIL